MPTRMKKKLKEREQFAYFLQMQRRMCLKERFGSKDLDGDHMMDLDEEWKILNALKEGQEWLDANPEADAEQIIDKHKDVDGICHPIVYKYITVGWQHLPPDCVQ